jgi:hypothetical protein
MVMQRQGRKGSADNLADFNPAVLANLTVIIQVGFQVGYKNPLCLSQI